MKLKESVIITLVIAVIAAIVGGIGAQSTTVAIAFFVTPLAAGILTILSFAGGIK